tara:strand:- start:692 stop:2254 length:1563 start_codon:yes stop_codon:yes gene_type:complete
MATHDYVIDNSTGANVRADLNDALAAIVSNNSSSSEPSTKYHYMWWADTTSNILKLRNSANDGWISICNLDGTIIADRVVTASIADDAITQALIANDAVGADQLASNSVVSDSIVDGSIVNADVNASAAIAGSKINPDFGSQDIKTTGTVETPTINDTQMGNKNMILNGAMAINQRGDKTGITSTTNVLDGFKLSVSGVGTYSVSQSQNSGDIPSTYMRNSLKVDVTTADTPDAADFLLIQQNIEGQLIQRLSWGTNGGQKKAILSFFAKADINGFSSSNNTFTVELQTSSSHEFSFDCQLSSNSTWQKFEITIDAFTAATLNMDNTTGVTILWWLDAGTNYTAGSTTSGSGWSNKTTNTRAGGQTMHLAAHVDNNFYITGVQFEEGEVATSFEHKTIAQDLVDCQRYYIQIGSTNISSGDYAMLLGYTFNNGTRIAAGFINPTIMRATPSISEIGNGISGYGQGVNQGIATIFSIVGATDTNWTGFVADGTSSFDWGSDKFPIALTNTAGGGIAFDASL